MIKKIRNDGIFKKPEIQKIVKSKKIINKGVKDNYKKIYIFSLASIFIIFSFFSLPSIERYLDDRFAKNKTIINISKKKFEIALNNNGDTGNIDENVNLDNIYDDIDVFSSNDENTNTSRLSASTIEQLFKDTDYTLKKVKKTKLVNIGNNLDHLPKEMKSIENVKKRKNLFIQIVLPLIIEENTKIKIDRKKLFVILNKNSNSKSDIEWLKKKI